MRRKKKNKKSNVFSLFELKLKGDPAFYDLPTFYDFLLKKQISPSKVEGEKQKQQ